MKWVDIRESLSIQNNSVKEFSYERGYLDTGGLTGSKITQIEYYSFEKKPSRANQNVSVGNIILARMQGTNKVKVIEINETSLMISTGFLVLKVKENFDKKFLFHYLSSEKFQREKDKLCSGATQKAINNTNFQKLKIPLIPLETQKKIAAILDKADELWQNDRMNLEKYDQLAQSVFLEMFGDPAFNQKKWVQLTLPEFIKKERHSIKRGPFGGALKKEIFVNNGYLVYEQFHAINDDFTMARYFIDEEKYNELIGFKVVPGDLIISCSGVTLGRIAEIPQNAFPGIINQALLKISLDNRIMNSTYFKYLFRHSRIQDILFGISRGSGIPNFPPMVTIKTILFPTPPIQLQEKFAVIILQIRIQKEFTQKSLQKSVELFQSLLQRAFRGELV
jgi:type I restriction enzyme S subunit